MAATTIGCRIPKCKEKVLTTLSSRPIAKKFWPRPSTNRKGVWKATVPAFYGRRRPPPIDRGCIIWISRATEGILCPASSLEARVRWYPKGLLKARDPRSQESSRRFEEVQAIWRMQVIRRVQTDLHARSQNKKINIVCSFISLRSPIVIYELVRQ